MREYDEHYDSKKRRTVAPFIGMLIKKKFVHLTIAAEDLSLQEGLQSAMYYRNLLEDIFKSYYN